MPKTHRICINRSDSPKQKQKQQLRVREWKSIYEPVRKKRHFGSRASISAVVISDTIFIKKSIKGKKQLHNVLKNFVINYGWSYFHSVENYEFLTFKFKALSFMQNLKL